MKPFTALPSRRRWRIKRATVSKWANRAAIATPRSAQTESATKAAKVWALRRADLRDISGEAAMEFLAEAPTDARQPR